MLVHDLGLLAYRDAWLLQEKAHDEVLAGGVERLLVVEHPPVITFGRRAEMVGQANLVAGEVTLGQMGVEVVQSDRGGDITFHGPGQLVVYPIIRLGGHRLSVGGYVRLLQEVVIAALREFGIEAHRDESAIGVWVGDGDRAEKICAIGVRIRRGISMHGLALNVTMDMKYFDLIVPCGIADRGVTSMQKLLGQRVPPMSRVKEVITQAFITALATNEK